VTALNVPLVSTLSLVGERELCVWTKAGRRLLHSHKYHKYCTLSLIDERELLVGAEVLLSLMSQYLELGGEREPGVEVGYG
jgi:hypothetical protein